eukprot:TRINITY_DN12161_c0_g1_i1.p1 TRINITY_DN12161_c0_g1~~TRINITY_DN12161_c0_g1_i1.p1  ORF type:complete len:298 (-),score=53.51 TRINITY_DN12161_c0_g1_i1:37-930(-)
MMKNVVDNNNNYITNDGNEEMDNVFRVLKDKESKIVWSDQNFLNLINQTPEEAYNVLDPREEHVQHDIQVLNSGVPQLNLHEVINVPDLPGKSSGRDIQIITQKGIRRSNENGDKAGITVNFSIKHPEKEWITVVRNFCLNYIPLGGFFLPTHSKTTIPDYSTNYYLLPVHDVLRFHQLDVDEVWFHHQGRPIILHMFWPEEKKYQTAEVGRNTPFFSVPAGCWFAGILADTDNDYSFCFVSCTLVPSWTKDRSRSATPEVINKLKKTFPHQDSLIDLINLHPNIKFSKTKSKQLSS